MVTRAYFGLLEDLKALFHRDVDLVVVPAMRNWATKRTVLPALAAWVIALGTTPAGAETDLIADQPALAATWYTEDVEFSPGHCAVVEGCALPGVRRLLRFQTKTANIGMSDLAIGNPAADPRFHFSPCHGHYHFEDFANYQVIDSIGNVAAPGHKQAFCLTDSQRYVFEPWVRTTPRYHCGFQGISAGWADIYGSSLDCQWVDVTNVSAGDYFLRVTVNPEGTLEDADLTNNVSSVPVSLPPTTGMPPRPDGYHVPGSPMMASHEASGAIRIDHDASSCPAPEYNLYHGLRQDLDWSYAYDGAICGIGTSGTALVDLPDPAVGSLVWFLVVGAEPSEEREGGHGFDSAGIERPLSGAGLCGVQRTHSGPSCLSGLALRLPGLDLKARSRPSGSSVRDTAIIVPAIPPVPTRSAGCPGAGTPVH